MSLIGEALKRARQEAAYQEAARDGRSWGPPPVYPPARQRTWPLIAAGVTAGALLVAGVGGGLYWLLGRDAREAARIERQAEDRQAARGAGEAGAVDPAAPGTPVIEELAPTATGPASPEGTEASPVPGAGAPVPSAPGTAGNQGRAGEVAREPELQVRRLPPIVASPVPAQPPAAGTGTTEAPPASAPAPPPPQPPAQLETRPAAPPPSAAQPERPAPAPPRTASGAAQPQSYVGEAPLPGGGKLELGGIADSADQPVALINGRVMGPGESIEGYTLVRIEESRVVLQNRETTIYLSLR